MKDTVNERFRLILEKMKLNPNSLSKQINITAPSLTKVIKGDTLPSSKILIPLLECYPQINMNWLLLGSGEMIIDEPKSFQDRLKDKNKIIAILEASNEDLRKTIKLHEQTIKNLKSEVSKYEKMITDKAS